MADSAFAYLTTSDRYSTGSWTDTGWVLGYFLVALGALWACQHPAETGDTTARATAWTIVGPQLPLAGAIGAAAWRAASHGSLDRVSQVTIMIVVVVVASRQLAVLFDNLALTRQLQAKVARRTAQLHHEEFHDGLTGLANRSLFIRRGTSAEPVVVTTHRDGGSMRTRSRTECR